MVVLGLLLVALGALVMIVVLFDGTGTVEVLGNDLTGVTVFLLGVGAGVAVLWGIGVARFGVRRSLQRRRESKQLTELSEKLDRVEAERRGRDDEDSST